VELTFFNFFSYWTNYAVEQGIPKEMIVLILMLPIIATIIAFIRQVIGLKTLGVYIPSILTISFLATGLKIGLVFFLLILILGTVIRLILKKLRLLYLPRIALLLTIISLATFLLIVFGAYIGLTNLSQMTIFPMLIMIILVERFTDYQIERGTRQAFILTLETLIISILAYFLMISQNVQSFILTYPGLILVFIIINLLLGRWTGLRLTEYFRFNPLIRPK